MDAIYQAMFENKVKEVTKDLGIDDDDDKKKGGPPPEPSVFDRIGDWIEEKQKEWADSEQQEKEEKREEVLTKNRNMREEMAAKYNIDKNKGAKK